eukprot:TRINITY_DN1659_c0_g1::TRINITY_DN1659_c0_g1_i1::g.17692::m.17692 TRINITY_DN1659_c0_g1::TRINITY_DN1659_c0_g1_i1::g.17692  ORF type:complete len:271 (+),score=69.91,sp/Q7SXW4/EMC3_DANRE/40.80/2e-58,DUF106/PF01956.11/8.2e-46 TRINITY_DN1659_c0_g1_i1:43-813(+)
MMDISDQLQLDPRIRDWVLLPIVLVMFLMGILRDRAARLLKSEKKPDPSTVKTMQILQRSRWTRVNSNILPAASFRIRKGFLLGSSEGSLDPKKACKGPNPTAMMMDPSNMNNMLKQNMLSYVPNMGMMAWVSYFFSGFVIVKIPFPLSLRFKTMFQRGIDLTSLDVSYVSALSWYFICLSGLRGLITIMLGENKDTDDSQLMQQQMANPMGGGVPGQFDGTKAFAAERENFGLVDHVWSVPEIEANLLKKTILVS